MAGPGDGEAWLLEAAVHFGIHLSDLAGGPEVIGRCYNFPDHGMTRAELLDALWALIQRGDVIADSGPAGMHVPTRDELAAALVPPRLVVNGTIYTGADELRYALTAAGGARWERRAEPDWGRYFASSTDYPSEAKPPFGRISELTAGSRDRLDEVIAQFGLLGHGEPVAVGPVETVGPWEATYWKTLPAGYRAWVVTRETWPVTMSRPGEAGTYSREQAERQRRLYRWTCSRWALHG